MCPLCEMCLLPPYPIALRAVKRVNEEGMEHTARAGQARDGETLRMQAE